MSTFKDMVFQDISNVFMNPEEFGETHNIDGQDFTCVIDDNEMIEREKRKDRGVYRDGTYTKQVLLYVSAVEFGPRPGIGSGLRLDGKNYIVTDAIDENGIYSISLEVTRAL